MWAVARCGFQVTGGQDIINRRLLTSRHSNPLKTNESLHFGKPCVKDTVAVGIVMHRHKLGTQSCRNQIYSRVLFLRQTRHCPQLPLVHVQSTKHPSLLTARTETQTQYLLPLNSEMLFQGLQEMLGGILMDFECTCYVMQNTVCRKCDTHRDMPTLNL